MLLWVPRPQNVEQVLQIRQRVRLEVAEKYDIVLVLKRVREGQRVEAQLHALLRLILVADDQVLVPVVVWRALPVHSLQRVLVVADIVATSLPLMSAILPILLERVDEGFHADGVRAVILLQVVDIELDCVALANVADGEEVPLAVGQRVVIKVEEQVVLALANTLNLPQIATFKL